MLNDVDFLLEIVVVSLVFGVLEVLSESRILQSIGAWGDRPKCPLKVGANVVFIGEILDWVVGRERPKCRSYVASDLEDTAYGSKG